ncbi:MAG: putative secreted protein [Sulfitobacter sp.]|jgi:predicted secreted protein
MGITSGIVLFVVIWAMAFMVALPIRVQTQGDLKNIVPGTHAGAPEHHHLKKKALWSLLVAVVIWGMVATVILSEWISVADVEGWFRAGDW